jgi:uncharacterized membrane protein YraQ (UPF0718 family)
MTALLEAPERLRGPERPGGSHTGRRSGGRSRRPDWAVLVSAVGATVLLVGPRLPGPVGPRMAAAAVSFVSLCAESLPFLLAGSAIAWALRRHGAAPLMRAARRSPVLAMLLAPFMGAALPLCDCGVVPLARELRDAGVPGRVVTAFAAGAPLTNPIVIASTALAFGGSGTMVGGRIAVGVAVALVTALIGPPAPDAAACAVDDPHEGHDHAGGNGLGAMIGAELAGTGPALVLGALVAGALRALAPTGALSALASQPLLAAVAMMALAAVLSLCSQADAFVAASLPVGNLGRLVFLVTGPVLSLRLGALYRRAFGIRWMLTYARTAALAIIVLSTAWITWGLH